MTTPTGKRAGAAGKTTWYVTTVIDGVVNVIQDVDDEGWIEWAPLNVYAAPWIFESFAEAFSCCAAKGDMVWTVPAGGIRVQP